MLGDPGPTGWLRGTGRFARGCDLRFLTLGLVATAAVAGEPRPALEVVATLAVTGELVAVGGADAASVRRPADMAARFEFQERGGPADPDGPAVVRRYRRAEATMRFGDAAVRGELAAAARDVLVVRRGTTPVPYLAEGYLTDEEYDLLDVPFDSLLIDDLLPGHRVTVGAVWSIAPDVAAGLLAIDTVESGGLEASLVEVVDGNAQISLSGIIDGAADGVPTHVTVEATLRVPLQDGPATRTGAAVSATGDAEEGTVAPLDDALDAVAGEPAGHDLRGPVTDANAVIIERRQASHVAPGFDVEARVTVSRRPLGDREGVATEDGQADEEPPAADAVVAASRPDAQRRGGKGAAGMVWHGDRAGRFDLVRDARWRKVEDGEDGLVMRLVDHGALVGQCSITALPAGERSAAPTREEVERDWSRSLAGQVGRIDGTEVFTRTDGVRIVRIASSGTAGRLPFRWVHYVLATPGGQRAAATFMFEESSAERFGTADRSLVEGLVPASGGAEGRPTAALPPAGARRAR